MIYERAYKLIVELTQAARLGASDILFARLLLASGWAPYLGVPDLAATDETSREAYPPKRGITMEQWLGWVDERKFELEDFAARAQTSKEKEN